MYYLINDKEIPAHTSTNTIVFNTQTGTEEYCAYAATALYPRYFYSAAAMKQVFDIFGEPIVWEENKPKIQEQIYNERSAV